LNPRSGASDPEPASVGDPIVSEWIRKLEIVPTDAFAKWGATSEIARTIAGRMVRGVNQKVVKAKEEQSPAPAEFFYTLFAFTRLNDLAFEIEEALPVSVPSPSNITRSKLKVRNKSIITGAVRDLGQVP
jgi:hypothetical protein